MCVLCDIDIIDPTLPVHQLLIFVLSSTNHKITRPIPAGLWLAVGNVFIEKLSFRAVDHLSYCFSFPEEWYVIMCRLMNLRRRLFAINSKNWTIDIKMLIRYISGNWIMALFYSPNVFHGHLNLNQYYVIKWWLCCFYHVYVCWLGAHVLDGMCIYGANKRLLLLFGCAAILSTPYNLFYFYSDLSYSI